MENASTSAAERVGPLIRVRQIRDFTDSPVAKAEIDAIADAARWSGSASNSQPWRFVVVIDRATLKRLADAGMPQTRGLQTAPAAIAVALPEEEGWAVTHAYDEGRATERILIAANLLGLGAGISWIQPANREKVHAILAVPGGWTVLTIVAIGHPSEAGLRPKAAPGQARLPRSQVVFKEKWPQG